MFCRSYHFLVLPSGYVLTSLLSQHTLVSVAVLSPLLLFAESVPICACHSGIEVSVSVYSHTKKISIS